MYDIWGIVGSINIWDRCGDFCEKFPGEVFPVKAINNNNIVSVLLRIDPFTSQRLGKEIPARMKARNNRTSIARQRISKHASLTV
jgi:hypothetical protein